MANTQVELAVFGGPSARYCPAGVYEWLTDEKTGAPMFQIIGIVLLFGLVFGSYAISGGKFEVILHAAPHELMAIGGAGIAAFLISNSMPVIKGSLGGLGKTFAGPKWKASDYRDLLSSGIQDYLLKPLSLEQVRESPWTRLTRLGRLPICAPDRSLRARSVVARRRTKEWKRRFHNRDAQSCSRPPEGVRLCCGLFASRFSLAHEIQGTAALRGEDEEAIFLLWLPRRRLRPRPAPSKPAPRRSASGGFSATSTKW